MFDRHVILIHVITIILYSHLLMATGFHAIAQKSSRLLFNRFKIARRRSAYTPLHHILERKPVRGNSCSCPCRTPWNDYVIRDIITPRWHARWYRFYDARRIRSCGDFWHKQHSFIVRQAVFLRRVVVDFRRKKTACPSDTMCNSRPRQA